MDRERAWGIPVILALFVIASGMMGNSCTNKTQNDNVGMLIQLQKQQAAKISQLELELSGLRLEVQALRAGEEGHLVWLGDPWGAPCYTFDDHSILHVDSDCDGVPDHEEKKGPIP